MKNIIISDTTLCGKENTLSFKEKLEVARHLDKLGVNVIEMPEISSVRVDTLLIKTISAFVKNSKISVAAGSTEESIINAAAALGDKKSGIIRIELPVSTIGMEYISHKKAPKMLEWISKTVACARGYSDNVEFSAIDVTGAERDFLLSAVNAAVEAGATSVSLCDRASDFLPDDFADFVSYITEKVSVPVGVDCDNRNGLANAQAVMSLGRGADIVKTSVGKKGVSLEEFSSMIHNLKEKYGFSSSVRYTELHRIINQIDRIVGPHNEKQAALSVYNEEGAVYLDEKDSKDVVMSAVARLGYDLSEEDGQKVYDEFLRVAAKKKVGAKELDAIVASEALQVPAAYKLDSYVINNGNIISSSAQITLYKNGEKHQGVCIGDGPIDAAFLAIDQILGKHYELDDFQIQSVTEGKEAMGSAIVKLRSDGKVYSGNGISTDIIGASIRAYINAVNKIIYEEE